MKIQDRISIFKLIKILVLPLDPDPEIMIEQMELILVNDEQFMAFIAFGNWLQMVFNWKHSKSKLSVNYSFFWGNLRFFKRLWNSEQASQMLLKSLFPSDILLHFLCVFHQVSSAVSQRRKISDFFLRSFSLAMFVWFKSGCLHHLWRRLARKSAKNKGFYYCFETFHNVVKSKFHEFFCIKIRFYFTLLFFH